MTIVEKFYLSLALACLAVYPLEPLARLVFSHSRLFRPQQRRWLALLNLADTMAVYGALMSGVFFAFVSLLLKYSRSPLAVWSLLALTVIIQVYLSFAADVRRGRFRKQVAYDPYYLKFDAATR